MSAKNFKTPRGMVATIGGATYHPSQAPSSIKMPKKAPDTAAKLSPGPNTTSLPAASVGIVKPSGFYSKKKGKWVEMGASYGKRRSKMTTS